MTSFINKYSTYRLMLYFLRVIIAVAIILSFFGVLPYNWWHLLITALVLPPLSAVFNKIFAKITGASPNYESQYITANILTLIVGPLNPLQDWPVLLFLAIVSQLVKYVFVYRKSHFLNPAAITILLAGLMLNQGASWWVGDPYLVALTVAGGLIIAYKLRWFHLINSFLATYVILFFINGLISGLGLDDIFLNLSTLVRFSALAFFIFVMLPEPITAPKGRSQRIAYGMLGAFVFIFLPKLFPAFPYPLETSLLLGNLLAFAISRNFKTNFALISKAKLNASVYMFAFEPAYKFAFQPGQFLEWTLPHKHDRRGVRRYMTIASSPTEKNILLVTRMAEDGSSFKKELASLAPKTKVVAGNLDGEFTLPKNYKRCVFVAGGIGITPYRSIIRYLLDIQNQTYDITLVYVLRSADDLIFRDLWQEAQEKLKFGLKTIVSAENQNFDSEFVEKNVHDYQRACFYLSGPPGMVESYQTILKKIGIKKNRIKTDFFPGYN